MDWIDLAQDRNRWWTVVNAVMNINMWGVGFHDQLRTGQFIRKESVPWNLFFFLRASYFTNRII